MQNLIISKDETPIASKNKNYNNNDKLNELIELAPMSYFEPDLLKTLDDNWFQKTAIVVGILEKKNNRFAAGHLKLFQDKNKEYALFSPNDSRLPRIKIKLTDCPPGLFFLNKFCLYTTINFLIFQDFYKNYGAYSNTIFIAYIDDIPLNSKYANGYVCYFFTITTNFNIYSF